MASAQIKRKSTSTSVSSASPEVQDSSIHSLSDTPLATVNSQLSAQTLPAEAQAFSVETQTLPVQTQTPAITTQTVPIETYPLTIKTKSENTSAPPSIIPTKRWWKPHSVDTIFSNWWTLELSSVLLTLLVFVALIVFLHNINGGTIPHWQHGLTVNAVISILATTARSSILLVVAEAISQYKWLWFQHDRPNRRLDDMQVFDDASRGPWGALKMLFRRKAWNSVYIGAVLTLMLLAFEPCIQQLVSYPVRAIDAGVASIPRAQYYDKLGSVLYDDTNGDYSTDPALTAAVHSGILNGATALNLSPKCSTGNCTWDRFASLAICTRCVNAFPDLRELCPAGSSCPKPQAGSSNNSYHYVIPGNIVFDVVPFTDINGPEPTLVYVNSLDRTTPYFGNDTAVAGIKYPLFGVGKLTITNNMSDDGGGNLPPDARPLPDSAGLYVTAVEACSLYFCVKAYDVEVKDGQLQSREVDGMTWYNEDGFPDYPALENTNPLLITVPTESAHTLSTKNRTYTVSILEFYAIANYLQNIFIGHRMLDSNGPESPLDTYPASTNPDLLDVVVTGQNLSLQILYLAAAMTNSIRSASGATDISASALGTAWRTESYVHVRWIWLLVPALTVLGALVFLLLVITQTARHNMVIWKSSVLALLYHGVERDAGAGNAERLSSMRETAQRTAVYLRGAGDKTWAWEMT